MKTKKEKVSEKRDKCAAKKAKVKAKAGRSGPAGRETIKEKNNEEKE